MSLNNIQLHPGLLAGLYANVLVEPNTSSTSEAPFPFMGKNLRNILILVSIKNEAFLMEEELSFLTNILKACELSINDVAIVNQQSFPHPAHYSHLNQVFNSRVVLLFDVEPENIDLPFHFPHFQVQQFDHCTYLSAPSLKEVRTEKVIKQKLWECLKHLFNL